MSEEVSLWVTDYTLPEGGYQIGKPKKPLLGNLQWGDGRPFDPPKNPLMEKWLKLYPPIKKPEYSQVCDGWSCDCCDRCPHGEDWKVPEEDLEEYNKWLRDRDKYIEDNGGWDNVFIPFEMSLKEWKNQ